jgi:hypothetical protein
MFPMRTRKPLLAIALAGLWAMSASPMLAAEDGAIDAQVTVATPCIIVSPASLDYGTLPFSSAGNPGYGARAIQLQNCGSSAEQMFARGTDATIGDSTVWALVNADPCTGAPNEYFLRARDNSNTGPFVGLTTTNQVLETVGAGNDALTNELQLVMPCVGSDGAGQIVTFQAIFTATF